MNLNSTKKLLSLVLCIVLIAAMALLATGCGNKENPETQPSQAPEPSIPADVTVKGDGNTSFYFHVTDLDGTTTKFMVKTDKETVGEALLELELIAGTTSDYGLYITSVNGITADWDTEKAYWAFYIGGEYAQAGVDATDIVAGTVYALEKTVSAE